VAPLREVVGRSIDGVGTKGKRMVPLGAHVGPGDPLEVCVVNRGAGQK